MMDNNSQIVVAHPPDHTRPLVGLFFFYIVVPVLAPTFLTFKYLIDKTFRSSFFPNFKSLYSVVRSATTTPITSQWYFQDATLLQKLWKLPSARAYLDEATQQPLLEYQVREGYCGSATHLCILRSFGLSSDKLPPQKNGESKPEAWSEHIVQIAKDSSDDEIELSTKIVRGNEVDYEEFLKTLRDGLANPNVRIGCNYLRSALTGFERYYPTHFIIAMFGGHFSPIVGIIENNNELDGKQGGDDEEEKKTEEGKDGVEESNGPYVAIFDTNHKFGGVYLVPARRLYHAVRTIDLTAKKHRATILVEKKAMN